MSPDTVAKFVRMQIERGASASTVAGYFWAVKSALVQWTEHKARALPQSEAALLGWSVEHSLKRIRLPKVQKGKRARMVLGLTRDIVDRVIRESAKSAPRRALIIEFLSVTGIRVGELCRLRLSEIRGFSSEHGFIRVLGKGEKERTVWAPESLMARIRAEFQGRVWLFESRRHLPLDPDNVSHSILNGFWTIAQYRLTAHNLRHDLATRLLRGGADPREVGDYLGHSSPAVTLESYDVNRMTVDQLKSSHWGDKGKKKPKREIE
jgi:integrase